jgi:two-component SAPR family response regulator
MIVSFDYLKNKKGSSCELNKLESGKSILLVYWDYHWRNILNKEIMSAYAKKISMRITGVDSAKDAFCFLTSNEVNLVISEFKLKDVYGIYLLDACKTLYPQVPFILHSPYYCRGDISPEYHPDFYVRMSVDLSELLEVVDKCIHINQSTEKVNSNIKNKDILTTNKLALAKQYLKRL